MCGIAGFLHPGSGDDATLSSIVRAMANRLTHRGPDADGVWIDEIAGLALGHRRLSILDLSAAGAQPMASQDGQLILSYNGEVYNSPELRAELEAAGVRFKGHSDTEVILEGFARWGMNKTLTRLIGMFAFALWNVRERTLTLARDQLGIKPLYWAQFGPLFLFGSELKALRTHPGFVADINRDAMAAFLRHNYIPEPHSVYCGVFKLEPGTTLTLRLGGKPVIDAFWTLENAYSNARRDQFKGSTAEATDALESLLMDAVQRQLASDVPLGVFLSGGIDSSIVAALAQATSTRKVRTFSIGFADQAYNESEYAAEVSRHLGTEHTELFVTPADARDVIPKLPEIYDEPFADSSQIPTYCLSALTKKHVAVALSGDGGDELFGGYDRYFHAERMRRTFYRVPAPIRQACAAMILAMPERTLDAAFSFIPKRLQPIDAGNRLHKLAKVMGEDVDDMYLRIISHWPNPMALVAGANELSSPLADPSLRVLLPDYFERMQYKDTLTYLPGDILTKVDRASMAVSLEVRVPLLDHRVVEFAWRLPKTMKLRNGSGKWLLRQVLHRYIPAKLIDRPKMGFGVPIDSWLRGPLRDWAETLLSDQALSDTGLFEPGSIRRTWQEHLGGRRNWQYLLWDVLMAQAWLTHAGSTSPSERWAPNLEGIR